MLERFYDEEGRLGVVYSPGYGAGWSTWYNYDIALDKRVVEAVLAGKKLNAEIMAAWGYEGVYCGGANNLKVCWIPSGTKFMIKEYDGAEFIVTLDSMAFLEA